MDLANTLGPTPLYSGSAHTESCASANSSQVPPSRNRNPPHDGPSTARHWLAQRRREWVKTVAFGVSGCAIATRL